MRVCTSLAAFTRKNLWMFGLVFCLLIAGVFSTYKLSESPKTWFDEGIFLQIARNFSSAGTFALRASPTALVPAGVLATVGFPVLLPISASFWLFGVGLLQARAVMVGFILLMVAAAFIFTRTAWGTRIALFSTLLIATHAPVYGNGKNVLGEVPGLFFFFVFLGLLDRLERQQFASRSLWIGTGFAAGMFLATKPSFFLLLPVLAVGFLLLRQRTRLNGRNIACGVIACVLPVLANLVIQFGWTSEIFTSFASYARTSGIEKLTGLTLPALIQKNLLLFVQESTPIYLLGTCLVWLAWTIVRLRRRTRLPLHEWIALGFAGMTVAYFLKMPGFFRYLFVAQIIAFPYAVAACFELRVLLSWLKQRVGSGVLVGFLAGIILFQTYQVMCASWVAGYYQSTRSSELAAYGAGLDPAKHVFLYHTTEVATFLKRENYSQYFDILYYDDAFGKTELVHLQNGVPDVVIVAGASEQAAHPLLGKYEKTHTLNEGNYVIFERK